MHAGFRAKHFAALDAFRGAAALWVVLFHAYGEWIAKGAIAIPKAFASILMHGWLGVVIFFVVSGYCIAERLAYCAATGQSTLQFMADRLWRLLPPYWAALGFTMLVNVGALPFNNGVLFGIGASAGALPAQTDAWIRMLTLQEAWYGRTYLLVSWTLSYEIAFYVVALLWFQVSRYAGWKAGFAGGTLMGIAALLPMYREWVQIGGAWPAFFAGSCCWLVLNRTRFSSSPKVAAAACAMLSITVSCCYSVDPVQGYTVIVSLGLMLISARLGSRLTERSPVRALSWVGKHAYSLYLIHAPIVGKLRNLVDHYGSITPADWVWPLVATAVAVLVSRYFYLWVESPSERARKAVLPRWFASSQLSVA